MNQAERWSHVSRILSRALDLPETDRAAFLAEAVRQEPALRTEVLALFEEMRGADDFLEQPPPVPAGDEAATPGAFGPYRVVGELGEGGMGVVYLAERSDGQFTRRVAVKRVGSSAPGAEVLRRFRDEREILARLDHPNIARLLDAGVDAGSVPYLVMEHVEGAPVTAYGRERKLGVPELLALFLKVCAAVQHAHQHLVIHRDIKPGNILVTSEGEPKLLDFGIAKILGETHRDDATRTLNRALTLDYASPEQVRGDAVATASDVYSLGVLLFELLAERKPYEVATGSLTEAVRLVCETVPPPPSRIAPPERRGELAGDLDSIVAKALEKTPADRYPSVAELAGDVRAHLDHVPVKARYASFAYVGRKFVRRHRAAALVVAAVAVALAAGVAAVVRQARIAERERARAQQRFEQVRQLANYVIFDLQDGVAKLAGATTLRRQMTERSLAYLDSLSAEAAGDTGLQMELAGAYTRLGDVLGRISDANLGDRAGALKSYGHARDLLESVVAQRPGDAEPRRRLAKLLLNMKTASGFDPKRGGTDLVDRAMTIWEALVREEPNNEDNLRGLASAHFSAFMQGPEGDRDKSVVHMQTALETFDKLLAAKPADLDRKRNVALCHKYLASYFGQHGDKPRAYEHAARAAGLDAERFEAEPHNAQAKMDYTISLGILADLQVTRERYDDALRQFERQRTLRRELYQADPANVHARFYLAKSLQKIALLHVLTGQPRLAAPPLDECMSLAQTLEVGDDGTVLLGIAYLLSGEVARATKQDPCPAFRRMAELLTDPGNPSFFDVEVRMRDRALARLKACPAVRP